MERTKGISEPKQWDMVEIQSANRVRGRHFFDADTKRFFRSRIGETVYQGNGGVFFITSEQFLPTAGEPFKRAFTVRQFNPETADISTAGPFNSMGRSEARTFARKLALGIAPAIASEARS